MQSAHAVMLIDKAMKLERMAREEKFDDERLLEMRREKVKPVIDEFYNFITTLNPGKGSHLYGAVCYARNQKEKLLVFLDHPEVEMTNNLAERTVSPSSSIAKISCSQTRKKVLRQVLQSCQ